MVEIKKLTKPVWKTVSDVKLCTLAVRHKDLGEMMLHSSKCQLSDNNYISEITSLSGEQIGSDIFGMYPKEGRISDFFIKTAINYREKFRIGELLRLMSIMEMFENGIKYIELYSKDTAVHFHAKYKFHPDIKNFMQRDMVLETIANDKKFKKLGGRAKYLREDVKNTDIAFYLRNLCRKTSELANEYLKKIHATAPDEYKKHPFLTGFNMILTEEDIIRNKDFFNGLFRKHGIDYSI